MVDARSEMQQIERWISDSQARQAAIQDELEKEEFFEGGLRARLQILLGNLSGNSRASTTGSASGPLKDMSIPDAIEHLLRDENGPLAVGTIVERLEEHGVTTSSEKGLSPIVASALSRRDDIFERVERGVYSLRSLRKHPIIDLSDVLGVPTIPSTTQKKGDGDAAE